MESNHMAIATAHSILASAPDFEKKKRRDEIEYVACLKNLVKFPLFPSITRDFSIMMKINRLDIGSWDHKEFCKIILQIPFHKFPHLTFDFSSGAVKFKAVKAKAQKSISSLFSYSGMRSFAKFQINLVTLCNGLSKDCLVYSGILEELAQRSNDTVQKFTLHCPLNTGLAGQSITWEPSEQPGEGDAQEIAIQLRETSDFYASLAI